MFKKFFKSKLEKGLGDIKNGKVYGPYKSVDEMFAEMDAKKAEDKRKNPLGYFLYWHVWLPAYRLWNNKITMIPSEIKWFIQRGKRGWADCDLWGFDGYIAQINSKALVRLKEIQHILPTWEEGETEEVAQKRWHGIMDDMIFAFDSINKEHEGTLEFWYEGCEKYRKIYSEKHSDLFRNTTWQTKEEHERMKKGMQLFIEHYFSLWD